MHAIHLQSQTPLTLVSRPVRVRVLQPWSIPTFGRTAGGLLVTSERQTVVGEILEVSAERAEQLVASAHAVVV